MIKHFFSPNCDHGIPFLAAGNLGIAAIQNFLSTAEPVLRTVLLLGQVAVTVATVVYIWRKAQAVKKPAKRARRKQKCTN